LEEGKTKNINTKQQKQRRNPDSGVAGTIGGDWRKSKNMFRQKKNKPLK